MKRWNGHPRRHQVRARGQHHESAVVVDLPRTAEAADVAHGAAPGVSAVPTPSSPADHMARRPPGDTDVARAHGRLQARFRRLRDSWDEDVEAGTNELAARAVAALEQLDAEAALLELRARHQTTGATPAPGNPEREHH